MCYHWTMKKRSSPNANQAPLPASSSAASALPKSAPLKVSSCILSIKRRVAEFHRRGLSGVGTSAQHHPPLIPRTFDALSLMYRAEPDPDRLSGITAPHDYIRLGTTDQSILNAFEAEMTSQRAAEPLPIGRLSYTHYRAIHRHFFQDVYAWAGKDFDGAHVKRKQRVLLPGEHRPGNAPAF